MISTYYPGIGTVNWHPVEVYGDGEYVLTIVEGWGLVDIETRTQRRVAQEAAVKELLRMDEEDGAL